MSFASARMAFDAIDFTDRRTILTLFTIPTITLLAGRALLQLLQRSLLRKPMIYRSPPKTLQEAHQSSQDASAYPPDVLPGARDVDTPYGSIRVYEWGPKTGKKVLFLHGISTPCIACAQMALRLVDEAGCRVMLFDLFGRGYSDTPDPAQYNQDIRLFTTQILLVLASSPLSWTGSGNSFTLVGYSLGGGIGASFASYLPSLVESLVLIAPAGLMRDSRFHWSSKIIYGSLIPNSARNFLVRRRIIGPSPPKRPSPPQVPASEPVTETELAAEQPEFSPGSTAPLIPNSTASAAESVTWQVLSHPGFLSAFISSIQHAPISGEHDRWRLIGSRLSAQKRPGASRAVQELGLKEGKVLIIFGKTDGVVVPEETAADAIEVLGRENVHIEMLQGGHDVPITNAQGCVDAILDHWDEELC